MADPLQLDELQMFTNLEAIPHPLADLSVGIPTPVPSSFDLVAVPSLQKINPSGISAKYGIWS